MNLKEKITRLEESWRNNEISFNDMWIKVLHYEDEPIWIAMRKPKGVYLNSVPIDKDSNPFNQKNEEKFYISGLREISFVYHLIEDYEKPTEIQDFFSELSKYYVTTTSIDDEITNATVMEKYKARKRFDERYEKYKRESVEILEYKKNGFRYAHFKIKNASFGSRFLFKKNVHIAAALKINENIKFKTGSFYYFISEASDLENVIIYSMGLDPKYYTQYPDKTSCLSYISTEENINELLGKIKEIKPSIVIKDYFNV